MKTYALLFSAVLLLIIGSCKKETTGLKASLLGRWEVSERRIGIGGPGEWTAETPNSGKFVVFKSNGRLEGTEYARYSHFNIADSTKLIFIDKDTKAEHSFHFRINASGALEMSPTGPIVCIEGCTTRFIKRK